MFQPIPDTPTPRKVSWVVVVGVKAQVVGVWDNIGRNYIMQQEYGQEKRS